MDLTQKLAILADAAKYDASCASSGASRSRPQGGIGNAQGMGICHSYTPDGRCISLLKLLLTNACVYDCSYCVNRVSSDTPRAKFTAEEVVTLTLDFYRRNYIEGLFLSSGILISPDYTMEQLIAVAKTLRETHRFGGYIHLKVAPGASQRLVLLAGKYADRLSANIEMASAADLARLAPAKTHEEVERTMGQISQGIRETPKPRDSTGTPSFATAGQSTQMIVGATATPDREILQKASQLYDRFRLRRVYYSAFSPIPHADPTLPLISAPLVREHRLYQSDWLIRFYGFQAQELTTEADGNLSLAIDPKLAWALANRAFFPVDLNRAAKEVLVRVPGLGLKTVEKIVRVRRFHKISVDELSRLGVSIKKVRPFVVGEGANREAMRIDEIHLAARFKQSQQLELWQAHAGAVSGEF